MFINIHTPRVKLWDRCVKGNNCKAYLFPESQINNNNNNTNNKLSKHSMWHVLLSLIPPVSQSALIFHFRHFKHSFTKPTAFH